MGTPKMCPLTHGGQPEPTQESLLSKSASRGATLGKGAVRGLRGGMEREALRWPGDRWAGQVLGDTGAQVRLFP